MDQTTSPPLWRTILKTNFSCWKKLAAFLELSAEQLQQIALKPQFPLLLPMRLASKIRKGTLDDPILRQFLPTAAEEQVDVQFAIDPTGDMQCRQSSKLLHKYKGRALLICTQACAMHCRYCFRQNFDYDNGKSGFAAELALIAADPSIHEVILSGGDPLSLSDRKLEALFAELCAIPHIQRLRIHSRFPIGIPERIDESFLKLVAALPKQLWVVVHANHPRELDSDVLASLKALHRQGATVLNQSVLLRGVNDTIKVQLELCETLANSGILPYYLHQLDRVQGSAHFEVPEEEGQALIRSLRQQLSGYAIPTYVREIYGEPSKTPLQI
jgi:EF-P beta-lysylation protein EpmB